VTPAKYLLSGQEKTIADTRHPSCLSECASYTIFERSKPTAGLASPRVNGGPPASQVRLRAIAIELDFVHPALA
jgi:hypothetical protein